ncbi:MAG: hypothetical protein NC123_18745 [Butyrivibrio sp.]|nr:hypothetical protein [Acetatifactor muris]MCM1561551.1 hypothetical protein [Butyrivibrio sp.]
MKRKIIALACAMTLAFGMSMSVSAAGSATASATAGAVAAQPSAPAEELVSAEENATGQVLTANTIQYFADTTTVSGVAGASLSAVSTSTAKAMIAQARTIAGSNTFIASIVNLNVPAGTGAATFTLGCPNVWKGQNVTILHLKSDGTYETIAPSAVEDNKVTFTMTSYSPVAIVINTGSASAKSPKTGEMIALVAALAAVSGIGAGVCGRKAKKN